MYIVQHLTTPVDPDCLLMYVTDETEFFAGRSIIKKIINEENEPTINAERQFQTVSYMMMMSYAVSVIGQMFHAHHLRCTVAHGTHIYFIREEKNY